MKKLIAAATKVAQHHRHAVVLPDHIVAAIAENDAWWRTRIAPVVRPELLRLVDERMASVPIAGTYRDGLATPTLAPETEELFEPSRWLRQVVGLQLVIKRLEGQTKVFKEVMRGLDPVRAEVRAAVHVVRSRNHSAGVRIEHVLWVLTEREWFLRALRMVGGDLDRFVVAVDERLNGFVRGAPDVSMAQELSDLVDQCALRELTNLVDSLLELALLNRRVQQVFAAANVDVPALQTLLTDGVTPHLAGAALRR